MNSKENKMRKTHSTQDAMIHIPARTHPLMGSIPASRISSSCEWSGPVFMNILLGPPPLDEFLSNGVQPRCCEPCNPCTVGRPAISRQSIIIPTLKAPPSYSSEFLSASINSKMGVKTQRTR